MKATILNIGNELLLGRTINTNAAKMALLLNEVGVEVDEIRVLSDDEAALVNALNQINESNEIVIVSGGLGPTPDDLTRHIISNWANLPLVLFEEAETHLSDYFGERFTKHREVNIVQAYFPKGAALLANPNGTAIGFSIQHQGFHLYCVPGVPSECIPMVQNEVIPTLVSPQAKVQLQREFYTFGLGETRQTELFAGYEFEEGVVFASLPSRMGLLVRLTIWSDPHEIDQNNRVLDAHIHNLQMRICKDKPEVLVGEFDLLQKIQELLIQKNLKVATAESCTAGLLGSALTETPGSTSWYEGGIQAYSNRVKMTQLNVKPYVLEEYGAVSEETAAEMALGVAQLLETNIGLSITGIAGPDGGSEVKPVGTVCFGVFIQGELFTETKRLKGGREEVRERSVWHSLDFLRRLLT